MSVTLSTGMALLLSAADSAKVLGISRAKFYALHSSGRLGPMPVELDSCKRWRIKELEAWTDKGCPNRDQWQKLNT